MRLIVGISGASGVVMGYQLLKVLKEIEACETHLILTDAALYNFKCETCINPDDVIALADYHHSNHDMAASISSGSFKTDGMIVIPCSMKTLSAIAWGYNTNLLIRSADVCLKENRRVVLVPREMPLGRAHLRNMLAAAENGCTIIPPLLTFYNELLTVKEQVNHIIGKILMQFNIDGPNFVPWEGC
jgi:4-hydroxy-3-polyprenylbenzoate decarboxylase